MVKIGGRIFVLSDLQNVLIQPYHKVELVILVVFPIWFTWEGWQYAITQQESWYRNSSSICSWKPNLTNRVSHLFVWWATWVGELSVSHSLKWQIALDLLPCSIISNCYPIVFLRTKHADQEWVHLSVNMLPSLPARKQKCSLYMRDVQHGI